jgi:hypothetical protein
MQLLQLLSQSLFEIFAIPEILISMLNDSFLLAVTVADMSRDPKIHYCSAVANLLRLITALVFSLLISAAR